MKGPRRENLTFGSNGGSMDVHLVGNIERGAQNDISAGHYSEDELAEARGHDVRGWASGGQSDLQEHHWADDEKFDESFDSGGAWEGPNLLHHQYSDVSDALLEHEIQQLRDSEAALGVDEMTSLHGVDDDAVEGQIDLADYELDHKYYGNSGVTTEQVLEQLASAVEMTPEHFDDALKVVR